MTKLFDISSFLQYPDFKTHLSRSFFRFPTEGSATSSLRSFVYTHRFSLNRFYLSEAAFRSCIEFLSPLLFSCKIPSQNFLKFFSSTRAYVTGISTFLLSQPSQYRTKTTSKTAISSVSSFRPKSVFFLPFPALYHCTFTNPVPNTLINYSLTASYDRFCEGCESKKCKFAGCARARTRESPIFTPHFTVIFTPRFPPHFPSHLRA